MHIIDTSVLIEAKNFYYQPEFCQGFWDFVLEKNINGDIVIIDAVKQEIMATNSNNDLLKIWLQTNTENIVITDNNAPTIQHYFSEIANDLNTGKISEGYTQDKIAEFLSGADPWLVATARHLNGIVVTNEVFVSDPRSKKVKIPNVCRHYGVFYTTPFEMLKQLGINLCHQ